MRTVVIYCLNISTEILFKLYFYVLGQEHSIRFVHNSVAILFCMLVFQ